MSGRGRPARGPLLLTPCCICGDLVLLHTGDGDSTLCAGCAPNLAGSIDQRLEPESCQVPEELYVMLLGPDPADETV